MVAIITFCNHGPIVFLKLLIKIGQQWSKHVRGHVLTISVVFFKKFSEYKYIVFGGCSLVSVFTFESSNLSSNLNDLKSVKNNLKK